MFTYSLFQGSFRFSDVYCAVTLNTYYPVDDVSIVQQVVVSTLCASSPVALVTSDLTIFSQTLHGQNFYVCVRI